MLNREGLRLGNYRLVRTLGKGAFAEVYLGEHLYLKNYAAIKVLLTELNEEKEQLFLSEAQTLAQLAHPNIVRVREFAIERATPFLVMDYAPGGALRQRHPKGSCLSLDLAVSYMKLVAAALQYAHNRGIIHRDVKPDNILQGTESIMLSDFGISMYLPSPSQSPSQSWAGTLPYMSPEQSEGQAVFASDQYSLAVIVYEWLCGVRPFEGTGASLIYQHRNVPPPPLREKDPSLPEAVEAVVLKALSKNPKDRYASVLTFARAFERASKGSVADLQGDSPLTEKDAPDSTLARRIFLSHAAADDVTRLKGDLEIRDVAVVDGSSAINQSEATMPAGLEVQQDEEKLRQAMRASQVVVLVVSPQARSSALIREHVRIAALYRRPLLCVWAAGDTIDSLLPVGTEAATLIDARGQHYGAALKEIVLYLEREVRGAPIVASPPPIDPTFEPRNPYKGLHAFTQNDRADFFGRESLVREMLGSLREMLTPAQSGTPARRLLAVVGPSGSGKSSVVMAGLLPRIQDGALQTSETWLYLNPLVPGKQPLDSLANALAPYIPNKDGQTIREILSKKGGFGLHQLALELVHTGVYVVLLIDQFEELFSPDVSEQERQSFIELLVTAATEARGPVLVLLTLRADLYDRPMAYPELGRLIQQNQCAVLPMDVEDLRSVIERPALQPDVRLTFDEDLVGDLLFDMHGQTGALPLLEFTLDQLFQHRRGYRLTRSAYEEIGGVRGALSRHAESTYAALPDEAHRQLARALFVRLIQPGTEGQEPIRRRADLTEVSLESAEQTRQMRAVIDAFVGARLLTINQVAGITTLEVGHEALLREWPRLGEWMREASEDMRLQQELSNDVAEWGRRGMPKDRLYRGSQLKESLTWQERNTVSANEAAFLRASTVRRSRERLRLLVVCLLLLALLIPAGLLVQQQLTPPTITSLADSGPGSLRQVIEDAKPGSTITIAPNLKGTISLTSSLNINKELTIRGPGAQKLTIGGTSTNAYLITILAKGNITFSDLTFSTPRPEVGAFLNNQGKLTLERCHIVGNTELGIPSTADPTQNSGFGAAIFSSGPTLTIRDSVIAHNTINSGTSYGGAITNSNGTLVITNSQITDNTVTASGQQSGGGAIVSLNGEIIITGSTISGNKAVGGQKISGGGAINSGSDTITLTNTVIADNLVSSDGGPAVGGGISANKSQITLVGSRVTNNTVSSPNHNGYGGGIYNLDGVVTLNNSTISGNTITANAAFGGGVASANDVSGGTNGIDELTLTNTTVSNNTARSTQQESIGGGILVEGKLTITGGTITNNAVTSDKLTATGGGIGDVGTLTISGSTVAGNTANASNNVAKGGGIFINRPSTPGNNFTLTNSTISGNTVSGSQGGLGGGIDAKGTQGVIDFATVYGNIASSQGGGIYLEAAQTGQANVTLKNSLIAANSAGTGPDIAGNVTTEGYNLIQRFAGADFSDPDHKHGLDLSGSQFSDLGINPQLRDNGGPTPTYELLANSPALNKIPPEACDVPTDQRGVKRPQQGACDIGAYEAKIEAI